MRRFHSYGPVDPEINFCVPRRELVEQGCRQLLGEEVRKGGHYITVWAPRQTGKTWIMNEITRQLGRKSDFDAVKLDLEQLRDQSDPGELLRVIARDLGRKLGRDFSGVKNQDDFQALFEKGVLEKPLVLVLDEFDALCEDGINAVVGALRNIYNQRLQAMDLPTQEKPYLLHGVALIGVRSVLGLENKRGSPFNVQRSLRIPNLTHDEVIDLFRQYQEESGQRIEPEVAERIYYETRGQPGLTSWLGELLTEEYNSEKERPITMKNLADVMAAAENILPNSNILNLINKAEQPECRELVLELFRTNEPIPFKFDDKRIGALYMNGVIEPVKEGEEHCIRFPSPFVQRRLFNRFAYELFRYMGQLVEPFQSLDDVITEEGLNIKNILRRYESYLKKNRGWLFKEVPRRSDLRIFEAVYHFNLFMFLFQFLRGKDARVYPEFPTGNGQIDILIKYKDRSYGLELKSFTDNAEYRQALAQAARYGKSLGFAEIALALFAEVVPDEVRAKYEAPYTNPESGMIVIPVLIETGE